MLNELRKNHSFFTLKSILQNRKHSKKSTFVAYLDIEKAFHKINRTLYEKWVSLVQYTKLLILYMILLTVQINDMSTCIFLLKNI